MANERKFIVENIRRVLLKEYLMKKTERAGFGGLDIQRTPMGTRISLFIERPGLVIGRGGEAIDKLTKTLEKEFVFDNPQIEVQEVENPSLNANIMAEKLAVALERGWHFRRAGHSTVRRIMDAGARGCQVVISGKLTGQRHRTEKFKEGHIKHCGEPRLKFMHEGFAVAKLKQGIVGVKVQIMDPTARLPDDIEIKKALVPEEVEVAAEEVPAVEEPAVEAPIEEEEVPAIEAPVEKEEAPPAEAAIVEKKAPPKEAKVEEVTEVKVVTEVKPEAEVKVAPEAKPELEVKAEIEVKAAPEMKAEEEAKVEEAPQVEAELEAKKEEPVESAAEDKAEVKEKKKPAKKKPKKKVKKEDKKEAKKAKKAKDLKAKKLKKVARKLEKLGEDVDIAMDVDEKEKEKKKGRKKK